ncbi:MAG TPA: glycosyltransferase family 39 protein [Thermoanaerobaculia bacterium]|nr:glycosyltransferase family 39 protein [Thermoanaerobaculia bacterium]
MRKNVHLYAIAAAAVAIHVACITQYGIFRDELYYLACGEHLDWGYVDQPPLIALIAWTVRHLFADSLAGIRILAVLAHGALVILTGLLARRLGGSRFAETLAATCALIAPVTIATTHFLSMNAFEPLFWMGMVYVALTIFNGASEKRWMLFGAIAGLSLENKHTTLFFGFAFVIGLLLSEHRRTFLRPWIWIGGVIAVLLFLPNLIWEVRHDFATIELLQIIARSSKNTPVTPLSFFSGQILLMHPLTLPIWIIGIVWLLRTPRYRALGWCFIALFTLFVVMKGKVYYLSPAYPMLFAAGGIAIERWTASLRWVRVAVIVLLVIGGAIIAPLALPILPVETYIVYQRNLHLEPPRTESHRMGPLPQQYADMFGWREMAEKVASAYNTLTPAEKTKCAIFGQNYGQAGAIDYFGPALGLPKAISAHQNYFFWGPRNYTGEVMIVMDDDRETLETIFEDVQQAGIVHHPYAMPYENDNPIFICRRPKTSLRALWPKIRNWI